MYHTSSEHRCIQVCHCCRCKFGQLGPGKGQFNSPHGFCLGMDEDIVVADTNNHRVQVFEKSGDFKYQFGIPGEQLSSVNLSDSCGLRRFHVHTCRQIISSLRLSYCPTSFTRQCCLVNKDASLGWDSRQCFATVGWVSGRASGL